MSGCYGETRMKKLLLCSLLFSLSLPMFAADPLVSGLDAYARSDWSGALLSFRKAAAENPKSAEPAYWIILTEISAGDLSSSLGDMRSFLATYPRDSRIPDVTYQLGRVQYLQGSYEDSITTLYGFLTTWPRHELAGAAYYWIGESLYAVGRFTEARSVFLVVLERYPDTVKREAAWYRVSLIDQGKKEDELLRLLKTSHEESLRVIEDYQRREKTYEQAITAYQKRVSDLMKDTRLGDLEKQVLLLSAQNAELGQEVQDLERKNAELVELLTLTGSSSASSSSSLSAADLDDETRRQQILETLRKKAAALQGKYTESLEGASQ